LAGAVRLQISLVLSGRSTRAYQESLMTEKAFHGYCRSVPRRII
jgi:hypothetical protein